MNKKIPHRGHELLTVLARLGGSARNAQIAQVMDVSEETVRRLVKTLAKQGKVERVHGGTYLYGSQNTPMYSGALEQFPEEKTKIGKAVARLISDGMSLFINIGSTTTYVAEQLRNHRDLTIVTNSISVITALAGHNGNKVFLAGGEINSAERGSFGHATQEFVKQFGYDAAIFGADGVSAKLGLTVANLNEAELSRVAASRARHVIAAVDGRKFGALAPHLACEPETVTDLVTDQQPSKDLISACRQWDIRLTVASD